MVIALPRSATTWASNWHYRIGLRNLETGRFTDKEVLEASAATPQLEGETK